VEAPWTLVAHRWNDGDHTMTHKMEIEMREGPYHITLSMHVMLIPFLHLILLRFDRDD